MSTAAPVSILSGSHRTRLKWHRARARATDAPFTPSRISEAMSVGASVEIDLLITADRHCVVLHDRRINRATTGSGAVRKLSSPYLRSLYLRDNAGHPLAEHVLLLDDLAGLLATVSIAPGSVLQLDFKQTAADLDDAVVSHFVSAVTPFARHAVLSCGDADAVRILTEAVPDLRVGYDPCHNGAADRALKTGGYREFVADAVAASPRAEIVYLDKRLVLGADGAEVDLIEHFHRAGREVDVYTFTQAADPGIDRALELRADQITTDDAAGVLAAREPQRHHE